MRGNMVRRVLRSGGSKGMLAALALLLVLAAAAVWMEKRPDGLATHQTNTMHNMKQLWSWADGELVSGSERAFWTVRWDVTFTGEEAVVHYEELGTHLGIELEDGGLSNGMHTGDGYRVLLWTDEAGSAAVEGLEEEPQAEGEAEQAEQIMREESPKTVRAVLLLEGIKGSARTGSAVLAQAERAEAALLKLRASELSSSISLHGEVVREDADKRIARAAGAQEKETYADTGTVSTTYYTAALKAAVISGGSEINLQLAMRQDLLTGTWQLAAGTPLITGEYMR